MLDASRLCEPKRLRPHQERAIAMLRRSLGMGNRKVVIQGPTGFGKTLVAAKIIQGALDKGNRVIFTAPAVSLIDQTVAALEAEGIWDVGVMQAQHPRTNPSCPVQVASVQTLARRDIPGASVVIVDECHIRSELISRMLRERGDLFFVGLSATPWRKGMGHEWDDLVIPATISNLIDAGYLSRFRAFAPDIPDMSRVSTVAGEFHEGQAADVMGDAKLVGSVVETWLRHAGGRPTLLFGVNCAHAKLLQMEFERHGVAAGYCDANTDRVERERLRRLFVAGEIQVACSVRTLTTGVDWPVSCIVDAAPTQSEMLHVQKIGRGLRVNEGTEDLLILDHAGNSLRLGLVTDIYHDTLDKTAKGEKQRKKPARLPKPCEACSALRTTAVCPVCGYVHKASGHVETADGELAEITPKKRVTMEDKQRFYAMALRLDSARGKGGKLAKALYRGRFGVWPRGLIHEHMEPDAEFLSYEKSRRIAYAKRMEKQRALHKDN